MKASQVDDFRSGQCVLYVGAGAGEDAVLAAERGVTLTCLDRSPAMLRRLEKRLSARALQAELVEADLIDFAPDQRFDVIVANFFLNVFDPQALERILAQIASLLAVEGRLFVADFRPPGERGVSRFLYSLYYKPLNWSAWWLGLCALHPIYDYAPMLEGLGLKLIEREPVGLGPSGRSGYGPHCFENLVAVRA